MRAVASALIVAALSSPVLAAGDCRFAKRPPVTLKDVSGHCGFDPETQSFAGSAAQQGRCLLTPVQPVGRLGAPLEKLPEALDDFVGTAKALPTRDAVRAILRERDADGTFAATLDEPVAHAHDNDPLARSASYLVLHDTSTPNFRTAPWPADIDSDPKINNLARYECANGIERAHVFINRSGAIFQPYDFSMPWRATKFESAIDHGTALKGLFLHVELIQPRRALSGYGRRNDFLAPVPGFSKAQYDALALTYTVASVRAGFWLIPAYHSVVDEGIRDKHDDPQNFDLDAFAASLTALRARLAEN